MGYKNFHFQTASRYKIDIFPQTPREREIWPCTTYDSVVCSVQSVDRDWLGEGSECQNIEYECLWSRHDMGAI